jgi:predicted sulfurtransferase
MYEPPLEMLQRVQSNATKTRSLTPQEWNSALDDDNTVLLDARNDYERSVGRMDREVNMIGLGAKNFREQVAQVIEELGPPGAQNKHLLMFCTR